MTIQAHEVTIPLIGPPTPVRLDDVVFVSIGPEMESAWREGVLIGELGHDEEKDCWRARKVYHDEFAEWRPMRCRAEARAFLVSLVRM